MESFGIPSAAADQQALETMLSANGEALSTVVGDLSGGLSALTGVHDQQLAKVTRALNRSLGARTAGNRKQLALVTSALHANLTAQTAANQSQIDMAALPVVDTGAPSTLPGWWVVCITDAFGANKLLVLSDEQLATTDYNSIYAGPYPDLLSAQAFADTQADPSECGPYIPPTTLPPVTTTPPTSSCPTQAVSCPAPVVNVTCPGATTTTTPPIAPPPVSQPPPEQPPPEQPPVETPQPTEPPPLAFEFPTPASCQLTGDGLLPLVGSAQWCACLDAYATFFSEFGTAFVSGLALPAVGVGAGLSWIGSAASSLLSLVGFDFPGANLLAGAGNAIQTGGQAIFNALQDMASKAPLCNPPILVGIAFARMVVEGLKHVRVGMLLPAEIDTELSLRIPQLEEILEYVSNYVCPVEIPSIADALECWRLQTAPEQQIRCWLAMRGASLEVWAPVLDARRAKLTPDEVIQFLRRVGQPENVQLDALRNLGFLRGPEAQARLTLYDKLPSVADFLHWLQRNVFDAGYVQQYRLMEGFDDRFWASYGPQLRALGVTYDVAAQHYAAHWVLPAPTQLQEFLYRLRPEKPGVDTPFDISDYKRLLAEQDIAPYAAERFAAIAYRVPALGYLRDMYRQYVISDDELRGYHQDLGYTRDDSERFVAIDKLQRDRMRARAAGAWEPRAAAQAYAIGSLQLQDVYTVFVNLGYDQEEADAAIERAAAELKRQVLIRARSRLIWSTQTAIKKAQESGLLSVEAASQNLQLLGFPETQSRGIATATDAAAGVTLIKAATARIKRALLSGEVESGYAQAALTQLGLDQVYIQRTLVLWNIENTPNRKRRSASQITADVAAGQMGTDEAIARLHNLGYSDADSRLFLADAAGRITKTIAKAQAAGAKNTKAQAAALQKVQQTADRQARQAQAKLRRLSPVGKLQKWAKSGLISQSFFTARMSAMGYDDADIQRYYTEACTAKGAQCAPAAAPAT